MKMWLLAVDLGWLWLLVWVLMGLQLLAKGWRLG